MFCTRTILESVSVLAAIAFTLPTVSAQAREYTDEELDATMELTRLQIAVAEMEPPLPLRNVLKALDDSKNLHWLSTGWPSCGKWHMTEIAYAIVTPHLKGREYYVVIQGDELNDGGSLVSYVGIGIRDPQFGGMYLFDVNKLRAQLKAQKKANQAALPTPKAVTPPAGQEARRP
jgi:hypothetical protein